jgi:hypothetical protein
MRFHWEEATALLGRTPRVLEAMLAGLPDAWTLSHYGEGTFSPFDVGGHLIHGERTDWIPRARIILEHGERQPFEPFDRYAMFEASKGKKMAELLDTFTTLRTENLIALRAMKLTAVELALGGTHPTLGRVTMEELVATWVAHDLNHIAQVAKALAFQYADPVGPWREYLSILRPPTVRMDRG